MNADVMILVQHVSRYLRSHPEACDTPEGIARWWVSLDGPVPAATVEAALGWMTRCGVVQALHAADGRTRYRRADGDDLDARLDALAADPQSVMPPPGSQPPLGRVH